MYHCKIKQSILLLFAQCASGEVDLPQSKQFGAKYQHYPPPGMSDITLVMRWIDGGPGCKLWKLRDRLGTWKRRLGGYVCICILCCFDPCQLPKKTRLTPCWRSRIAWRELQIWSVIVTSRNLSQPPLAPDQYFNEEAKKILASKIVREGDLVDYIQMYIDRREVRDRELEKLNFVELSRLIWFLIKHNMISSWRAFTYYVSICQRGEGDSPMLTLLLFRQRGGFD